MAELSPASKDLILLFSVPGIYGFMLLMGRRLKRTHGVRLSWSYHLFALCVAFYFPAKLFDVPFEATIGGHPVIIDGQTKIVDAHTFTFRREVGALTGLLGTFFLLALIDRYVWELYFQQKHRVKIPRFLSEVVTLLIITVAIIVVLEWGYQVRIQGLVIGPSVLAVIVGLAMQDLLGNIFAGLALQFGKTFKEGDWLLIENRYAQVIDINWRATRLRTVDAISIDVPNRDMAKQTVINLNLPGRDYAMRLSVNVESSTPPTRVKDVLLHATCNAKHVLPEPRPSVYLKNFGDFAIEYEIKFWLSGQEYYHETCDSIRTNIWYSLRRHGIRIPNPIQTIQLEKPQRNKEQEIQHTARLILRQQALFKTLTDDQLDTLLPRGQQVHFGRGEKLIEQGAEGESMFILVNGEANVVVERNGSPTHIASLRSGDCFGEMSLLTGERRSATIVAHSDCEVVEIGKAVLARNLKENPDLLGKLSALLARRQMETEGIVAANTKAAVVAATQTEYADSFMTKLQIFFEL